MDAKTKIKVLNRDNGRTGYSIPEMSIRRVYAPGETKEITFEELQKLSYIPGGKSLLKNNLVILNNTEAIKELIGKVQPEYNYTETDIKNLMINGTLDEFLDCLDFAPQGVIDLIKKLSVDLPLNDVKKREAIFNKTNFNVDEAINLKKAVEQSDIEPEVRERRVAKPEISQPTPARRVVKREV